MMKYLLSILLILPLAKSQPSVSPFAPPSFASDPSTCSVPALYYNTTLTALKECTATNTWSLVGATAQFSTLIAGTNNTVGTFIFGANPIVEFNGTPTSNGFIQIPANFSSAANGSYALWSTLTFPSPTRGTNSYGLFGCQTADTIANSSECIFVNNSGSGDGIFVQNTGLSSGSTNPTALGVNMNLKNGSTLPCSEGSTCQNNSSYTGTGLFIQDFTYTSTGHSIINIQNMVGGVDPLATFANSYEAAYINIQSLSTKENGICLQVGSSCIWQVKKGNDNSFNIVDTANARIVGQSIAGSSSLWGMPNGASIGPGTATNYGTSYGVGSIADSLLVADGTLASPVNSANPTVSIQRTDASTANMTYMLMGVKKTGGYGFTIANDHALEYSTVGSSGHQTDLVAAGFDMYCNPGGSVLAQTNCYGGWFRSARTSATTNLIGFEMDITNSTGIDAPFGSVGYPASSTTTMGMAIYGSGTGKNSQAINIFSGNGSTSSWWQGISFGSNSLSSSGGIGLNFNVGSTGYYPMMIENNTWIGSLNSTGGQMQMISTDTSNRVVVGGIGASSVLFGPLSGSTEGHPLCVHSSGVMYVASSTSCP